METKKEKINIIVTGAGSELAFSIIKALKNSTLNYNLICTDIYPEVVGKYWCDQFYLVSPVSEEKKYISEIKKIVKNHSVRILIPTIDKEFSALSKLKEEFINKHGCYILINDLEEIKRFNDKWLSYLWYIQKDIPTPKSILINNIKEIQTKGASVKFPAIIKPRVGGGARSIYKVNSWNEVIKYSHTVPGAILQEYLYPDNEEYTAGTYRTRTNKAHTIILKRTLKFGMTNTAEVIINKKLHDFVKSVILKTNLSGSNNIQFRVTEQGPKVLEINPRFSGTTGIRAHFGFNDLEMYIRETIFKEKVLKPKIKRGFVLRYMHEQYHIK